MLIYNLINLQHMHCLPSSTYQAPPTKLHLPSPAYQAPPTKPCLPSPAYQAPPTKPCLPECGSLVKSTYVPSASAANKLGTYRGKEGSQSSYASLSMSCSGGDSSSIDPNVPRFSCLLQDTESPRSCVVSQVGESKVKDVGKLRGKSSLK